MWQTYLGTDYNKRNKQKKNDFPCKTKQIDFKTKCYVIILDISLSRTIQLKT